jgi:hypothetical protein
MLRRVALVRTEVSEEISASVIRVTIIGKLRTTLATDARGMRSSKTSVLTRATRCNIPEDTIIQTDREFPAVPSWGFQFHRMFRSNSVNEIE